MASCMARILYRPSRTDMTPEAESGAKMPGVENSWLTPGGRLLRRLDVFLSEPLRRAAPEDLGRYRLLILVSLGLLLLHALSLLFLPWSPEPWVQGPLA